MDNQLQQLTARMDLADLLQHLLHGHGEQAANMLDRTKCSTTARAVYNYLTGSQDICQNENLKGTGMAVQQLLPSMQQAVTEPGQVFYVHFDHITGDTSHYFIIVQRQDQVVLLQSAVFEFSIQDWLLPNDESDPSPSPCHMTTEKGFDSDDVFETARRNAIRQQAERDVTERQRILESIRQCAFSQGRVMSICEFGHEFVPALLSLEGTWHESEVPTRCDAYARCFSCIMNPDMVRSRLRTGSKPGELRYCWAPLKL